MKTSNLFFVTIFLLSFTISGNSQPRRMPVRNVAKTTTPVKAPITSPFMGIFTKGWAFESEIFLEFINDKGTILSIYVPSPINYEGGFQFLDGTTANEALIGKTFRVSFEKDQRTDEQGKQVAVNRMTRVFGFYEGTFKSAIATSVNKVSVFFDDVNSPVLYLNQEQFSEDKYLLINTPDEPNNDYIGKKLSVFYEANDEGDFFVRDFRVKQ
ncbi:MAG TPA: hypothetical protein PKH79_13860 [Prolixibacteraceae bacterium]|nr:hypothetical protein [Prolixibacteraceae bacterium]